MGWNDTGLASYGNHAIKAAKDFGYGKEVIRNLTNAKTIGEIDRIMRNARNGVIVETPVPMVTVKENGAVDIKKPNINKKKGDKTYKCSEVINTCIYSRRINGQEADRYCNYLCVTRERRGCPAEECTRYKSKDGNEDSKVRLYL